MGGRGSAPELSALWLFAFKQNLRYSQVSMARSKDFQRHYEFPGCLHELTFGTYHRQKFFRDERLAEIVTSQLLISCISLSYDLAAFVVMPDHCHLLVRSRDADYSISEFLKDLKMSSAKACFEAQPDLRSRCGIVHGGSLRQHSLWQRGGGFDRSLYSTKAIQSSIVYIEKNPVKAELSCEPHSYTWSSSGMVRDADGLVDLSFFEE